MNTLRIAESTWSSLEPEDGRFDFSYIDRVLAAAEREGMSVIIGTPTYALPPWLVKREPENEMDKGRLASHHGRQ